jgi:hypothetical protein
MRGLPSSSTTDTRLMGALPFDKPILKKLTVLVPCVVLCGLLVVGREETEGEEGKDCH